MLPNPPPNPISPPSQTSGSCEGVPSGTSRGDISQKPTPMNNPAPRLAAVPVALIPPFVPFGTLRHGWVTRRGTHGSSTPSYRCEVRGVRCEVRYGAPSATAR